jgi:peroxiredoxin
LDYYLILFVMRSTFTTHQFLLIIIVLLGHGCNAPAQSPISGNIELHPGWKPIVYLVQPRFFSEIASNYLGVVVDSAIISGDGQFAFKQLPETSNNALLLITIQKNGSRFANQLMDEIPAEANYMPLVYSPGKPIVIDADASAFQQTFTFENPSLKNKAILSLRTIRLKAFDVLVSSTGEEMEADSMLLEKDRAFSQYRKALMNFADTTTCIEAAMVAIRWISPTGDFERVPEFAYGQCQRWKLKEPDHPFTKQFCAAADKDKLPVMVGDMVPDFPLPLSSGDTILLSKRLGHRLTLVDIWAAWCAPCRKENKTVLAPLWQAYQDKGLQIIGYSIDNNAQSWKAAIAKDGAVWTQASHLSGDSTPFLETLHITTIPANFILDAEGRIVAKNLFGEELSEFVKTYLK